jgi:hypothetical protein
MSAEIAGAISARYENRCPLKLQEQFQPDRGLADVAQLVEHVLGKDEVTGSIPVVSFSICANFKGLQP